MCSIYKVHAENKDKDFELELSWLCPQSKMLFAPVPPALVAVSVVVCVLSAGCPSGWPALAKVKEGTDKLTCLRGPSFGANRRRLRRPRMRWMRRWRTRVLGPV
jgi:hypothetical protein